MHDINPLEHLAFLGQDLAGRIVEASTNKKVPANTELLRIGQYVKVIPVVLSGLVKVFTRHDGKELLLYYIQPNETCTMSFSASLKNEPSRITAVVEEDSQLLLLPAPYALECASRYPAMNHFFFLQFNKRYSELLDTINHLLFDRLDERLLEYLRDLAKIKDERPLQMTHRQIATELGTSREVITRLLHKLEAEGRILQAQGGILVKS